MASKWDTSANQIPNQLKHDPFNLPHQILTNQYKYLKNHKYPTPSTPISLSKKQIQKKIIINAIKEKKKQQQNRNPTFGSSSFFCRSWFNISKHSAYLRDWKREAASLARAAAATERWPSSSSLAGAADDCESRASISRIERIRSKNPRKFRKKPYGFGGGFGRSWLQVNDERTGRGNGDLKSRALRDSILPFFFSFSFPLVGICREKWDIRTRESEKELFRVQTGIERRKIVVLGPRCLAFQHELFVWFLF